MDDPVSRLERLRSQRSSAKWRAHEPDVLPAWIAEMDFDLAPSVTDALHEAVDRGDTGYRWAGELPEAMSEFMGRHLGWRPDPALVLALPDVLTAIAEALRRLTSPGSSVVITPPVYPPFFHVPTALAGRALVEVPLVDAGLDLDGLERVFARSEVESFLLCHPHNPTGYIPSVHTLTEVARLARRHGITVISDEIWSPLAWAADGVVPYLAIDPELTAPDVALVSASKAFNLAGLKCAQVVAGSPQVAERLFGAIPAEVTYATGHFGVIASLAAYRDSDAWLATTKRRIEENLSLFADELHRRMPRAGLRLPQATYLAWVDCRDLGLGDDPAAAFAEIGRVAVNSGPDYGEVGRGFVRVNVATDAELVVEIVRRMAATVS